MNIRPYKKGDESQILWLINNTWKTAYSHIFPSEVFAERERTIDDRIKAFDEKLTKNKQICFVAEENLKIVGVLVGILNSNIEEFDQKGYARINILYIDENFQSCGIGKKLVKEFLNVLKQKHINKYVVGVLKDNKKARIVYEKWGGKLTSYTEDFKVFDVPYDEVFYEYEVK
ncbi:MAG: GNAT family N-acetyltransferase [Clostridia bacterium]|nr:GNAT family N-acetyltransferase [Clostridia bacterium]